MHLAVIGSSRGSPPDYLERLPPYSQAPTQRMATGRVLRPAADQADNVTAAIPPMAAARPDAACDIAAARLRATGGISVRAAKSTSVMIIGTPTTTAVSARSSFGLPVNRDDPHLVGPRPGSNGGSSAADDPLRAEHGLWCRGCRGPMADAVVAYPGARGRRRPRPARNCGGRWSGNSCSGPDRAPPFGT